MSKFWNFIKVIGKPLWYAFLNILIPGIAILLFIFGFQYDIHCGVENFNWGALAIYTIAWLILLYWAKHYYRFNKLENKKSVKILYDRKNNRVIVFGDSYINDICEFEYEDYDSETDETREIKPEFFETYK